MHYPFNGVGDLQLQTVLQSSTSCRSFFSGREVVFCPFPVSSACPAAATTGYHSGGDTAATAMVWDTESFQSPIELCLGLDFAVAMVTFSLQLAPHSSSITQHLQWGLQCQRVFLKIPAPPIFCSFYVPKPPREYLPTFSLTSSFSWYRQMCSLAWCCGANEGEWLPLL